MPVRSRGTKPLARVNPSQNESRKVAASPASPRQLRHVEVGGVLPLQGVYGRGERLNRMLYIGCIVCRRDVELDSALEDPALT